MRRGPTVSWLGVVAAAIAGVACGADAPAAIDAGADAPPSGPRDPFIAFAQDFRGYGGWEKLFIKGDPLDDPIHGGDRTIFVNRRPPKGSGQFPVGTIVVKRMESAGGQIFAMVKRGGGFNAEGAAGWEWFRIVDAGGEIGIAWRGMSPPDGESYGGGPGGVCNGCHFAAKGNDWVMYSGLALSP